MSDTEPLSPPPPRKFPAMAINPELLKPYVPTDGGKSGTKHTSVTSPVPAPMAEPSVQRPTQPEPIEQLMEEARLRGASRMIPDTVSASEVTDAQAARVLELVKAYRDKTGISVSAIGKAIGYSSTVISQSLNAKYTGDWRRVILDLDKWFEAQLRRDNAPKAADFVWTAVAQEIKTVASTAVTTRRIGLIYGPETSGIGKTLALKAVAAELSASVFITIRKTSATMRGLLDSICEAMRLSPLGSHDDKFNRIAAELRDTPRLLIVDQIHNLCGASKDKPFYVLADLFDATNAPQLWSGTRDIVAYLDRGQARGDEPLAQIRSRIVIARDLLERTLPKKHGGRGEPLFSIDEIRKIFAKNKIRLAADGHDYLYKLSNLPNAGALRTCVDLVVMATTIEELKGTRLITSSILRAVHKGLRNWRAFEVLEAKLADEAHEMPVAARVG